VAPFLFSNRLLFSDAADFALGHKPALFPNRAEFAAFGNLSPKPLEQLCL
jgi:hypothetical protein